MEMVLKPSAYCILTMVWRYAVYVLTIYRIAHAGILHTIPILSLIIEFMHDRIGETIARRLFRVLYVVKIQMKRHTAPHELRFS